MKTAAIIPAAGLGTRMGRGTSRKQFMLLNGDPILVHTIRKFLACPAVNEIVVALRNEDLGWFGELLRRENPSKPVRLVAGGDHRQVSVQNGLAAVSADIELAAVHDAVRPFVSVELIEKVIAEATKTGAAILGIPPVDTVKQVHRTTIRSTLPRERIVLAQTPQVFRVELLRRAYQQAEADGLVGTDEASLVEHLDVDVTVVLGSDRNIKITRPSDMALARLFLQEQTP
ncbi:MAG: 2-C-methyl-D-erythritol 4-phosphate cytidylyltransferase [Acidobacteria bacterium]|nr:2-C-methyl-D-erythritol 4-phosphate cytidylyltransferase [Acidobacteriota bacterium]